MDLITRENLNWFTDNEDLFPRLCRSLETVLASGFHIHSSQVDEILLRLRSQAESQTGREATPKQELYQHYWKPWIKVRDAEQLDQQGLARRWEGFDFNKGISL